jgi:hypothetical protein
MCSLESQNCIYIRDANTVTAGYVRFGFDFAIRVNSISKSTHEIPPLRSA